MPPAAAGQPTTFSLAVGGSLSGNMGDAKHFSEHPQQSSVVQPLTLHPNEHRPSQQPHFPSRPSFAAAGQRIARLLRPGSAIRFCVATWQWLSLSVIYIQQLASRLVMPMRCGAAQHLLEQQTSSVPNGTQRYTYPIRFLKCKIRRPIVAHHLPPVLLALFAVLDSGLFYSVLYRVLVAEYCTVVCSVAQSRETAAGSNQRIGSPCPCSSPHLPPSVRSHSRRSSSIIHSTRLA